MCRAHASICQPRLLLLPPSLQRGVTSRTLPSHSPHAPHRPTAPTLLPALLCGATRTLPTHGPHTSHRPHTHLLLLLPLQCGTTLRPSSRSALAPWTRPTPPNRTQTTGEPHSPSQLGALQPSPVKAPPPLVTSYGPAQPRTPPPTPTQPSAWPCCAGVHASAADHTANQPNGQPFALLCSAAQVHSLQRRAPQVCGRSVCAHGGCGGAGSAAQAVSRRPPRLRASRTPPRCRDGGLTALLCAG
jgi:hypothetical protein